MPTNDTQAEPMTARAGNMRRWDARLVAALAVMGFVGTFNLLAGISARQNPEAASEGIGFILFGLLFLVLTIAAAVLRSRRPAAAASAAPPIAVAAALVPGQGVIDLLTAFRDGFSLIAGGAFLLRLLFFFVLWRGYRAASTVPVEDAAANTAR